MAKVKLKLEHRGRKEWWVTGQPHDTADCGPYDTKGEAQEDKVGLEKFWNELWKDSDGPDKRDI